MKKCRVCKEMFNQRTSLQMTCTPRCAIAYAQTKKGKDHAKKARRADMREFKAKAKSRGDWMKEAQVEFNKFIRLRDAELPCISCGITAGQMHSSHYRSVGACPELRFSEVNAHKACAQCNTMKSGNIIEYRIELLKRTSMMTVDWIEGPHEAKNYTIEDLKEIKAQYKAKWKELEAV